MRIDIHHHVPGVSEIQRDLQDLRRVIMASKQEVLDKLRTSNTTLDKIRADVAALKAKVDANGEVDPEIVAAVDALNGRLEDTDSETPDEPTPETGGTTG